MFLSPQRKFCAKMFNGRDRTWRRGGWFAGRCVAGCCCLKIENGIAHRSQFVWRPNGLINGFNGSQVYLRRRNAGRGGIPVRRSFFVWNMVSLFPSSLLACFAFFVPGAVPVDRTRFVLLSCVLQWHLWYLLSDWFYSGVSGYRTISKPFSFAPA